MVRGLGKQHKSQECPKSREQRARAPRPGQSSGQTRNQKGSQWEVGWVSPEPTAQGEFGQALRGQQTGPLWKQWRDERDQASRLLKTSALGTHFSKNRAEGEMWAKQRPAPPMSPAEPVATQTHATRATCTPGWGWGIETTGTASTAEGQGVPGACQNLGRPVMRAD